ncbi:MAG: hypothetical protein OXE78_03120 [Gammaproteobacteria bacterium]|nr:hypothetical protein [Gammaproteobacteria bacterium]
MKRSELRLNTIVHLVTIISVLAGVAFVAWELEQQRELLRLEMFSEGTIATREMFMSVAGENPSIVLAKACAGAESLSVADLIVLNYFYNETMETVNRMRLLESGLYPPDTWQIALLESRFGFIFSSSAGRAWWENYEIGPEVREPVDAFLAKLGPPDCMERFDGWRTRAVALEKNRKLR